MRFFLRSLALITLFLPAMSPDGVLAQSLGYGFALGSDSPPGADLINATAFSGNQRLAAGVFTDRIDFDPGSGMTTLDQATQKPFVASYSDGGALLWVSAFVGSGAGEAQDIDVDPSGNIWTVGPGQNLDYDPGPGVFTLTNVTLGFISKLDGNGNFLWAGGFGWDTMGGYSGFGNTRAIASAANGDVVVTGWSRYDVDFDPGPGSMPVVDHDEARAGFVVRLSGSGGFQWLSRLKGSFDVEPSDIAVTPSGDIVVVGVGDSTTDYDPGVGIVTSSSGPGFVVCLAPDGSFRWVRSYACNFYAVTSDSSGNVIAAGKFNVTGTYDIDLGPGTFEVTSGGGDDALIVKFDSAGTRISSQTFVGNGASVCRDVQVDSAGAVYATGTFSDICDFDPGPGIAAFTNSAGAGFVCKVDAAGSFVWNSALHLDTDPFPVFRYAGGDALAVASADRVLAGGQFTGVLDLDPGPGATDVVATNRAAFLVELVPGSSTGAGASSGGGTTGSASSGGGSGTSGGGASSSGAGTTTAGSSGGGAASGGGTTAGTGGVSGAGASTGSSTGGGLPFEAELQILTPKGKRPIRRRAGTGFPVRVRAEDLEAGEEYRLAVRVIFSVDGSNIVDSDYVESTQKRANRRGRAKFVIRRAGTELEEDTTFALRFLLERDDGAILHFTDAGPYDFEER